MAVIILYPLAVATTVYPLAPSLPPIHPFGPFFARTFIRQTKAQTSRCQKKNNQELGKNKEKINLTQFTKNFYFYFFWLVLLAVDKKKKRKTKTN